MYKQVIIDNEDYTAALEYQEGYVFLHCDIHNFNKTVYKNMIRDWLDMEEALGQEGFDKVYAVPLEEKGFIERTGWELLTTFDHWGQEKEIYVWELVQQQQ